jgi:hypothetical protein
LVEGKKQERGKMNTKRVSTIVLSLILFASLFMGNYTNAQAQAASDNIVTFAALGRQEILLSGPVDSRGVDINIPANWSLTSGSKVHLDLQAFVGDANQTDAATTGVAGYIDIYMNGLWLQTIALDKNGNYSADVDIPDTAWRLTGTRQPQTLSIALHDAVRCSLVWASAGNGTWRSINVAVSTTSYFDLPHQIVAMPTDLTQLPYPLYQQSFQADKTLVITPDQPTESELKAALIVEAALGRVTDGGLITSFTTVSSLTPTSLSGTHAIFVGKPSSFPQLSNATLPLAPNGDTFSGQQILADDGILELVPSPVDPARVWLLVSGNDDAGIVKAAQAVGSGSIRPYGPSGLAIVSSVQPQPATASTTDFTLADLGYSEQKYASYGLVYFSYYFYVLPTETVTDGAYFQLTYNNSALLNFQESGISILLNDQFAGSVRFNDRTTDASTVKFNIPASMFHAGRNSLLLEANLAGMTPCIPVDQIWVAVKADSSLHIPSLPVSDTFTSSHDLAGYPQMMFPSFDNLAFIVTRDNPASWEVAGTIAYEIGKNTRDSVIQPVVAYADAIPSGLLQNNNQIIIGRPSALPVLQDLAQVLPAPFTRGTDIATEKSSAFTYNIPETEPVGYLQIMPSPWNNKQTILAVLGNGDQGLRAASLALATNTIRSQMAGNLAIIYNNQVTVDKVELAPVAVVATPVVLLQSTPAAASGSQTGPFKLNFVTLGLGILAIIVILGLLALLLRPKKKKPIG